MEPLVLLLLAVAVLYGVLGELEDAVTILFVILAVAAVEMVNESRARKAIGSLRTLSALHATTISDSQVATIPAAQLVSGDVVLLQPGERVPADLRLVEAVALRADESSLRRWHWSCPPGWRLPSGWGERTAPPPGRIDGIAANPPSCQAQAWASSNPGPIRFGQVEQLRYERVWRVEAIVYTQVARNMKA